MSSENLDLVLEEIADDARELKIFSIDKEQSIIAATLSVVSSHFRPSRNRTDKMDPQ